MSLSAEAIDRIVENVLNQISAGGSASKLAPVQNSAKPLQARSQVSLPGSVITAEVIGGVAEGSLVTVRPKAIITPAAWDAIRLRRIQLERGSLEVASSPKGAAGSQSETRPEVAAPLLIVVRNTSGVRQLEEQLAGKWKRELLGCPDDAAKLAISEISRGAVSAVIILAEQSHRAACLANRHEQVKAVAVQDAGDVRAIRQQLRANVWCVNPDGRSYFELRNLIQQIEAGSPKR